MKICLLSPRFISGDMRGGEEVIRTLSSKLSLRHKVTVIASDSIDISSQFSFTGKRMGPSTEELGKNLTVVRLKSNPFLSYPLHKANDLITRAEKRIPNIYSYRFPDLVRIYGWGPYLQNLGIYIKNGEYDVVHASIFPTTTAYTALKHSMRQSIPFVFTPYFHFKINSFNTSYMMRYLIQQSDAVVACTPPEKEALIKLGADEKKIHVIPLSFDPEPVDKMISSMDAAKERFLLGEKFVVLSHPWISKGIIPLLKALSELSDKHDIALLTIGHPDDGYETEKNNLLGKHPRMTVVDLGWVSPGEPKWNAFSSCDVFALPSYNDAFGISYLNAWAAKKPIIAARDSAGGYLVDDHKNGYLVDPDNITEIKELLLSLMENRADLKLAGEHGKKKLVEQFSPDLMVQRYEKVFKSVLEKR